MKLKTPVEAVFRSLMLKLGFVNETLMSAENTMVYEVSRTLRASDTRALKKMFLKRYAPVWCMYSGVLVLPTDHFSQHAPTPSKPPRVSLALKSGPSGVLEKVGVKIVILA